MAFGLNIIELHFWEWPEIWKAASTSRDWWIHLGLVRMFEVWNLICDSRSLSSFNGGWFRFSRREDAFRGRLDWGYLVIACHRCLPQGKILYIFAGRRFDAVWRIRLFWRGFSYKITCYAAEWNRLTLPEAFGFCWARYSVAGHGWWSDMAGQPWLWTSTAMPLGESSDGHPLKTSAQQEKSDTMIAGFGKTSCWGIETQLLLVIMAKNEKNEKNSENEHSKVRFWMVFDFRDCF